MNDINSQKRGLRRFIRILSVIIIVVGAFYLYKGYQARIQLDGTTTISENNFYTLRKNATEYQKKIYKELSNELNNATRDDKQVVGLIAQNYVADFYTWTNKLNLNDVGGLQFLSKDIRKNVMDQALDSFYNDMFYYLEKKQIKDTLEVTDSSTTVSPIEFQVSKDKYVEGELTEKARFVDAYEVSIQWEYKPSTLLNVKNYQKKSTITITKDKDGLYSILEVTNGKSQTN